MCVTNLSILLFYRQIKLNCNRQLVLQKFSLLNLIQHKQQWVRENVNNLKTLEAFARI
ncbi:hypothetical protein TTHERM_00826990 (macronuclear) [Tetrahymena thermophila SB210]|uniref:Uncharacterized protein n=1 Tax=Tetrahymena thermophila (strain SB210) TaxID=312017 RepID=Q22EH0_TETTS|nr:hypothetical protein TTHERM_00826990 [Tetrahymena thermophila SB210]EAR83682.1 hypothetical protein TTHERM_00826990 [Tetrahymena thermophila SB210]|eukprot:XP_001031345.1 hypothetical protein TTHERM_00826990 [Tetrahymena thermophila SB210]